MPWQERNGAWAKTRLCPAPRVSRTVRVGGKAWVCCKADIWFLDRGVVLLGEPMSHSTLATSGQWDLPRWLQRPPAAPQAQRVKQVPGREKRDWPWVRAARPSQLLGFVWRVRLLLVPSCGIGRRIPAAGETTSITTIVTTTSSTTTGSSHHRAAAAAKLGKGFECGTLAEPEPSLSQGLRPPASCISPLGSCLPARRWERKWATRVLGRGGRNHQLPRPPHSTPAL